MKHYPEETNGCYYNRPETACYLCQLRMIGATVRVTLR